MSALRLGARVWALAIALPVLALLPQSGQATMWWSAAVHTTFSFAGIAAALYCATRANRWNSILCAIWFAIALTFTAKTLFALALLWGFAAMHQSQQGHSPFQAALRALRGLMPSIAIAVTYLLLLKAYHEPPIQPHPSLLTLAAYVWELVSDFTLGSSFGLGTYGLGWPRTVCAGLVFLLAAVSVKNNKALIFPWLGLVAYMFASSAVIGWERAVLFPGGTLRYCVEASNILLVVIALSASAICRTNIKRAIALTVAVLVAVNLLAHRSEMPTDSKRAYARSFIENFEASAAKLPTGAVVADTQLPEEIVPGWMVGYSRAGWLTRLYAPSVAWGDIATATHQVQPDGNLALINSAANSN